MQYYIFLYGDTVIWCASESSFNTMLHDEHKRYKYMGTITDRGLSMGPNIEPFNGKNI